MPCTISQWPCKSERGLIVGMEGITYSQSMFWTVRTPGRYRYKRLLGRDKAKRILDRGPCHNYTCGFSIRRPKPVGIKYQQGKGLDKILPLRPIDQRRIVRRAYLMISDRIWLNLAFIVK